MTTRQTLIAMLTQLRNEMDVVQSQGAGYYTCVPFAKRFNRLLSQARILLPEDGVVQTFDDLEERDPKDPGDKSKVLLEIRVEIGQLITLLESLAEDHG